MRILCQPSAPADLATLDTARSGARGDSGVSGEKLWMQEAGRAPGTDRAEGLLNRIVLVRAGESLWEKTRSGNAFHPPVGTTNLSNFELQTAHSYFDRSGTA